MLLLKILNNTLYSSCMVHIWFMYSSFTVIGTVQFVCCVSKYPSNFICNIRPIVFISFPLHQLYLGLAISFGQSFHSTSSSQNIVIHNEHAIVCHLLPNGLGFRGQKNPGHMNLFVGIQTAALLVTLWISC